MNECIKDVYAQLEQRKLDGLILSLPANISYLTGFISYDAYLVISKKDNIYITDSRYTEAAKKSLKGCIVQKANGSIFKAIAGACISLGLGSVGFEERYMPFAEYNKIKEGLGKVSRLIPTHSLVEHPRQVKSARELVIIRKALQITVKAFKFIKDFVVPGRREIEVAAELERFIRYNGAYSASFDTIVASGPNSSFPHHRTSQRKIQNNEPVMIDFGVDYLGYKTDLTRVFFLGKITTLARQVYGIVIEAQQRAINKIKPYAGTDIIDKAARQHITQKGYGGFFGHNLGHGVGLEIHEGPAISGKEAGQLEPGMVFTVEPAIYLPGKFGIRIEDMVLVTRKGCEVLSGSLDK